MPAPYRVELARKARKVIERMDVPLRERILAAIRGVALDPHAASEKLKGYELYRHRVGVWCIIYQINDRELVVLVVRVAPRREVYDSLGNL